MSQSILERAAMAAHLTHSNMDATWEDIARAVLMAVRKPDRAMIDAGINAWPFEHDAPNTAIYRQHTAMIDAILNSDA